MDREEKRTQRDLKIARLLKYFSLIMAIFYLGMGITIAFFPLFAEIPQNTRYTVAVMLFVYGVFRFYRQLKKQEHE